MSQPDAITHIENLRLHIFIDVKEGKILNRQDITINIVVHYPVDKAHTSEDINDALSYHTITKSIIAHVENSHFSLLGKLTQDVLNIARGHR